MFIVLRYVETFSSARPRSREKEQILPKTPDNDGEVLSRYANGSELLTELRHGTDRYKAILVGDHQVQAIREIKQYKPQVLQKYVLRARSAEVMEQLNHIFQGNDRQTNKAIQEIGRFPGMNFDNRHEFTKRFENQMAFLEQTVAAAAKRGEVIQVRFFSNPLTNHFGFHRLRELQNKFGPAIQGSIFLENGQTFDLSSPEAKAYRGYGSNGDAPSEASTAASPTPSKKPIWKSALGTLGRWLGRGR